MSIPEVFSCGFLLFRKTEQLQFLLMQHAHRWDLPKGHVDPGETKMATALRELREETGISSQAIWIDPDFTYSSEYWVTYKRKPRPSETDGKRSDPLTKLKELTIYLAFLREHIEISLSEHMGFQWFDWNPPHHIQTETIDPLLDQVRQHVASSEQWPPFKV